MTAAAAASAAPTIRSMPHSDRCGRLREAEALILVARRRRSSSASVVFAIAALAAFLPTTMAVVSYCADRTPQSMTREQGEILCSTAGEYRFAVRTDKGSGKTLYDDLGADNVQRRYTALASFDAALVAKYVNYSDYALFVKVNDIETGVWRYQCCQVCENDCAQNRYVCPLVNVTKDSNCSVDQSQVARCRYGEELVMVSAQLLCAVKVSSDFYANEINSSSSGWWQPGGVTLRTSWRNCPYRELAVNGTYLLMASASTPLYGASGELVGADIVVSVKRELPAAFFRGMSLDQPGYAYLEGKSCPTPSAIRRLSTVSSMAVAAASQAPPPAFAAVAAAAAAVAAARLLAALPALSTTVAIQ